MIKLLLLDKDGTIARSKSGATFINTPTDQEIIPGAEQAIMKFAALGYIPMIISNQGGVQAGFKSLKDAIEEMQFCMKLIPEIDMALFCPDSGETCYRLRRYNIQQAANTIPYCNDPESYGLFRKPQPGMINFAIRYNLRPSDGWDVINEVKQRSIYVGDRPEDEGAARSAGVPFMWAEEWRTLTE